MVKRIKEEDFPEEVLRDIIRRAIREGKVFDLLFTEEGRRLWAGWPERQVKKLVLEELKKIP